MLKRSKVINRDGPGVALPPRERDRTKISTKHSEIITGSAKEFLKGSRLQQRGEKGPVESLEMAGVVTKMTDETKKILKDTHEAQKRNLGHLYILALTTDLEASHRLGTPRL